MASRGKSLLCIRDSQGNLPEMKTSGVSPPTMGSEDEYRVSTPQEHTPFFQSDFYEKEYNRLVSKMCKEEVVRGDKTVKPFQKLLRLSVLVDKHVFAGKEWKLQRPSRVNIKSLLERKHYQDKKHDLFMSGVRMLEQKDLERTRYNYTHWRKPAKNAMEARLGIENLLGCSLQKEKQTAQTTVRDDGQLKDKIAWNHFTKGYCKLGEACKFRHSLENAHPDSQKLFLGGLPKNLMPETLVFELREKGYNIINNPKVFRGFCPEVCLGSTEDAQRLLREGKISILGCSVDVRTFIASTQNEMNCEQNVNDRSVFLGGVPLSITVLHLKAELEKMGIKVTNYPQRKSGFIPKLTLATAHQAKQLIAKGVIDLHGVAINVRPYKPGRCRTGKKQVTQHIYDVSSKFSGLRH